jgi:hypothetical protein
VDYGAAGLKTLAVDCGSIEVEALIRNEGSYDYILNLSAMKLVRSESDLHTLMRMTMVNVFNTGKTLRFLKMVQESTFVFLLTKQQIQSI